MTTTHADDVLVVRNLNKTFGKNGHAVHANAEVNLTVKAGHVVCLLGHNGAGKTTLVNQVVGLTLPDSGTIHLRTEDGMIDAVAQPAKARAAASVQAQSNVPITGLTPLKAIELVGRIRGIRGVEARRRARHLIDALELGDWENKKSEKVSGGVARLTAFAMAAISPGRLVVLDEPTNDVDPVRRRHLWAEIRRVADQGAGILVVTHNVHEAEHVVDHVVLLDRGRVVAEGTPAELKAVYGCDSLEDVYVTLLGTENQADQDLAA